MYQVHLCNTTPSNVAYSVVVNLSTNIVLFCFVYQTIKLFPTTISPYIISRLSLRTFRAKPEPSDMQTPLPKQSLLPFTQRVQPEEARAAFIRSTRGTRPCTDTDKENQTPQTVRKGSSAANSQSVRLSVLACLASCCLVRNSVRTL